MRLFLWPCLCQAAADLNLVPDWDHAPFLHGVASADPLETQVLIWTRVSNAGLDTEVLWGLWSEGGRESFEHPLRRGRQLATASSDFTVSVDVTGLRPGSRYLYQFSVGRNRSMLGHTRTASNDSQVDLAILSCTSLWSGFFNFYRQLAVEDLDAVVHVGDLVYERPDPDELLRVPDLHCDEDQEVSPLQAPGIVMDSLRDALCSSSDSVRYRALHSVHMFDPDFRLARSKHPFIVIYDNHDINWRNANSSLHAFREWVPMRASSGDAGSYRHFHFGNNLLDLFLLDTTASASKDSLLGEEQHDWLGEQLMNSSGAWRLFASPKTFMPLTLNRIGVSLAVPVAGIALLLLLQLICCRLLARSFTRRQAEQQDLLDLPGNELYSAGRPAMAAQKMVRCCSVCAQCIFWLWLLVGVVTCILLFVKLDKRPGLNLLHASRTTWEGHPRSREALFEQLRQSGKTSNNIWAVGDMHFSYIADVFHFDYQGQDLLSYHPGTSSPERFGVEFMPGSGSRGNMDEKAYELLGVLFRPPSLLSRLMSRVVDYVMLSANPHVRHFEGSDHGYGLLRITPQQVQASWVR
ncbi:phoD, partial [Symbiodinium pilosum]